MSKRQPPRSAVCEIPPTTFSDSNTCAGYPCLVRSYAAVKPAGPAPMMTVPAPFMSE